MLTLRHSFFAIAAVASVAVQAAAQPPQMPPFRTITLKDARSITEAMAVNAAVDGMMVAAGSCQAHGLEAALSCACASTAKLARLKAVYSQTSARHPDWNKPNTIVAYVNPPNGHFISLNFAATSGMIARCEKR